MVGAVLVKSGRIIGRGWHRRAGLPHAEIEAIRNATARGHNLRGAILYVTLEPCSTHGRTPPCTDAIISAGIRRIVIGATDPNPKHKGKGFALLRRAGINVTHDVLGDECAKLNEAFNHWIVHRTPFVTVKAGMTLDGKIATANGESRWVTGEHARALAMTWRQGMDAILVGVNTVILDDPQLTFRPVGNQAPKILRRIVLDSVARTPLTAKVVRDEFAMFTTIVVGKRAPKKRVDALAKKTRVVVAPLVKSGIDLRRLMKKLGGENVTSLLVEGGGEVNASFLFGKLAHRVTFFYAPKILGGNARKGVAGRGVESMKDALQLKDVEWKEAGEDLLMMAYLA
jgi:diaminohydroxyphosphoribosylaminopyrimidine deaminase/5-amino-6-(5-phosphoribosylamino)uracil reductase